MHGVSATPGIQPKVQVVLRQGHRQFRGKALVNTGSQITSIMPEIVEQAGFCTFKMQQPTESEMMMVAIMLQDGKKVHEYC